MFVTYSQLIRELQRSIPVQSHNISDRKIITGISMMPARYAPGDPPLDENRLYICEFWQLKRFDPSYPLPALLCVVEPNADPPAVFFSGRSIAVVYGTSVTDTLLALCNVGYDLGCKSSLITEVSHSLLACKTIPELMEEGFRALKNPLIIADQDQKILWYTDPDRVSTPIYRTFLSSEYLPVGHPNAESIAAAWSTLDVPFQNAADGGLFPVIIKPLFAGDKTLGHLHVIQFHHELEQDDANIAELLGNLLSVMMLKLQKKEPRDGKGRMQRFLRDILDNQLGTPDDAITTQKQLGLTFKPCLYALSINIRRPLPADQRIPFSDLVNDVDALLPGAHALFYRNSAFALIEATAEIRDPAAFLAPLGPLLEKYDLICGFSNPFRSVFDLRSFGYQTNKAIQLGTSIDPGKRVYLYCDYTVDYMMEMCLRHESAEALYSPAFLRLIRHCSANGDALMETLAAYLRCGRNKSETAKALFVHLNTVKYRLAQAEKVMGVSLDDDSTVLDLMLSFRLVRHRESFGE